MGECVTKSHGLLIGLHTSHIPGTCWRCEELWRLTLISRQPCRCLLCVPVWLGCHGQKLWFLLSWG